MYLLMFTEVAKTHDNERKKFSLEPRSFTVLKSVSDCFQAKSLLFKCSVMKIKFEDFNEAIKQFLPNDSIFIKGLYTFTLM